jgi:thioredoxin reductase (NADPH)
MPETDYDLIIAGGGPAGLTAGLYAGRAMLKTLLLERMILGGQAASTFLIENYPGFPDGIPGPELSQAMEKQAKAGLIIENGEINSFGPPESLGNRDGGESSGRRPPSSLLGRT